MSWISNPWLAFGCVLVLVQYVTISMLNAITRERARFPVVCVCLIRYTHSNRGPITKDEYIIGSPVAGVPVYKLACQRLGH